MKEYGYLALVIYFGLLMIDLPICYAIVHALGKEKIEFYENKVKQVFGYGMSDEDLEKKIKRDKEREAQEDQHTSDDSGVVAWVKKNFSWSEFAIAYGLHKSLIFIRLPLCAAITPSIVKMLRNWGFKIGLGTSVAVAKDKIVNATDAIKDYSALNPKFGTPAGKRKWWFF